MPSPSELNRNRYLENFSTAAFSSGDNGGSGSPPSHAVAVSPTDVGTPIAGAPNVTGPTIASTAGGTIRLAGSHRGDRSHRDPFDRLGLSRRRKRGGRR